MLLVPFGSTLATIMVSVRFFPSWSACPCPIRRKLVYPLLSFGRSAPAIEIIFVIPRFLTDIMAFPILARSIREIRTAIIMSRDLFKMLTRALFFFSPSTCSFNLPAICSKGCTIVRMAASLVSHTFLPRGLSLIFRTVKVIASILSHSVFSYNSVVYDCLYMLLRCSSFLHPLYF